MCSGRFMQPPSLSQTAAIFLVAICCQTHSQVYADFKNLLHEIDGPHSRFEDDASIFLGTNIEPIEFFEFFEFHRKSIPLTSHKNTIEITPKMPKVRF